MPKITKIRKLSGYTLIEFLIVIAILSLSVGSILLFLTSTIKGANQANVTSEVKQNGQRVLDSLQSQIRSSSAIREFNLGENGLLGSASGILLQLSDGGQLNVICVSSTGSNNGSIKISKNTTYTGVADTSISNYQPLTNTDPVSGVDIVCGNSSGSIPAFKINSPTNNIVVIDLIANQGKNAPSRADFLANVEFKTTIALRQYQ